MNREIKFRQAIIHPVTGKFIRWHYWGLIDGVFVGIDTGWSSSTVVIKNSYQYIGISDKNGVEGYDGDEASKSGSIWVVIWNGSEGCWQLKNELYPPLPIRKLKEMWILGNRWESPELLEKK